MIKAHSLRRWMLGSLAGIAILGPVDLYGFGHLVFHVPVARLWEPFWVLSIPILMLAPSMYWASNSQHGPPEENHGYSGTIHVVGYCFGHLLFGEVWNH